MRKFLIALIAPITFLVAFALPGFAQAHVEIGPVKAPAAKPVKFTFTVGHGCDGAATNRLVAQIPEGVTAARPLRVDGWKTRSTGDKLVWSGGPLGDHDHGEFPFKATLAGERGDKIVFKVIQGCEGGAETAWIQVGGKAGQSDDGEHDAPAPVVTLTTSGDVLDAADDSAAAVPDEAAPADDAETTSKSDDDGGISPMRIVGLVLIVAAATAYIVMRRNRRKG